jgi:hypothetical protein
MRLQASDAREKSIFRWKPVYLDTILVLCVFLVTLGSLLLGEKIDAGQGFGYDGGEYANIAQNFETLLAERSLDSYRIQRILPPAIVHYVLKLLGVGFTPPAIITAFGLLNVTFFTVSAAAWCGIANHLNVSTYAKLIGFIGLFVNFAVIKMASYYPVLTDNAAFMLGVLALYFYLIQSRIGLFSVIVAGTFTWPTVAFASVPLILFPRNQPVSSSRGSAEAHGGFSKWLLRWYDSMINKSAWRHKKGEAVFDDGLLFAEEADGRSAPYRFQPVRVLMILVAFELLVAMISWRGRFFEESLVLLAVTLALLFWAVTDVRVRIKPPSLAFWLSLAAALYVSVAAYQQHRIEPGWYDTIQSLLPLSYGFVMLFVFAGLFILWNSSKLFQVHYWLQGFRPHVVLIVVGILLGSSILQSRLSGIEVSSQFVLRNILLSAIQAPGIFLVAHVVYFGPIVIVTVLYWRQASELVRDTGGGLLLMTSLALLFLLMSESRTIINFFPLFVMITVGALDRHQNLSGKVVMLFALLSLFMSRVWLQISQNHDLYYFMNFGPWMGRRIYFIFAGITIVVTILIFLLFKRKRNKRTLALQEV